MPESRLEAAKRTRKTDFGTWEDVSARIEDTKIETPIGTFVCYHDGTFSDLTNMLMWIQAPWGMTFNGKKFKGEATKLRWDDAKQLFGYGGVIGHLGALGRKAIKQFEQQYGRKEYERGICEIKFSGYSDWRLPTAAEILSLCLYHTKEEYWQPDESKYDGYRHNGDSKSKELWQQLFPAIPNSYITLWSANDLGSSEAWCFNDNGGSTLGDHYKHLEYPVLFVRNL